MLDDGDPYGIRTRISAVKGPYGGLLPDIREGSTGVFPSKPSINDYHWRLAYIREAVREAILEG